MNRQSGEHEDYKDQRKGRSHFTHVRIAVATARGRPGSVKCYDIGEKQKDDHWNAKAKREGEPNTIHRGVAEEIANDPVGLEAKSKIGRQADIVEGTVPRRDPEITRGRIECQM